MFLTCVMESPNKMTLGQMTGLNFDMLKGTESFPFEQAHLRSPKHQIMHSFVTIDMLKNINIY